MISFKFLSDDNGYTITNLCRYHKRLLDRYITKFNLYPGKINYNAAQLIVNTTINFIINENLTTYNEIRSYYRISYQYLLNGDYDVITDEDHEDIINSITYLARL